MPWYGSCSWRSLNRNSRYAQRLFASDNIWSLAITPYCVLTRLTRLDNPVDQPPHQRARNFSRRTVPWLGHRYRYFQCRACLQMDRDSQPLNRSARYRVLSPPPCVSYYPAPPKYHRALWDVMFLRGHPSFLENRSNRRSTV